MSQDPLRADELAELAEVPFGAVRPMLDQLEREGMVRLWGRDSRKKLWEMAS